MANISPLCPYPFVAFTLETIADDVLIEANPAPYNNTKEILVLNQGLGTVYMKILDLGEPATLPVDPGVVQALVTGLNSTIIPTGASVSLCLGTESQRQAIRTAADWTANGPGSQLVLVFRLADAGVGPMSVNVTYVQSIGGASGP